MSVKIERITILCTPAFKAFLRREAKKEGVSVSQLVRERCEGKSADVDEQMLALLVAEVRGATRKARQALTKGLNDAKKTLAELRA